LSPGLGWITLWYRCWIVSLDVGGLRARLVVLGCLGCWSVMLTYFLLYLTPSGVCFLSSFPLLLYRWITGSLFLWFRRALADR